MTISIIDFLNSWKILAEILDLYGYMCEWISKCLKNPRWCHPAFGMRQDFVVSCRFLSCVFDLGSGAEVTGFFRQGFSGFRRDLAGKCVESFREFPDRNTASIFRCIFGVFRRNSREIRGKRRGSVADPARALRPVIKSAS